MARDHTWRVLQSLQNIASVLNFGSICPKTPLTATLFIYRGVAAYHSAAMAPTLALAIAPRKSDERNTIAAINNELR